MVGTSFFMTAALFDGRSRLNAAVLTATTEPMDIYKSLQAFFAKQSSISTDCFVGLSPSPQ